MSTSPQTDGGCGESDDQWEELARRLLQDELEEVVGEVADAFGDAAVRVGRGDDVTEQDVQAMIDAISSARGALEDAAEASPETAPVPDVWDVLDEDTKADVVDRLADESPE
jgi:hypothetical protein